MIRRLSRFLVPLIAAMALVTWFRGSPDTETAPAGAAVPGELAPPPPDARPLAEAGPISGARPIAEAGPLAEAGPVVDGQPLGGPASGSAPIQLTSGILESAAVSTLAVAAPPPVKVIKVSQREGSNKFVWNVARSGQRIDLLTTGDIELELSGPIEVEEAVRDSQDKLVPTTPATGMSSTVTVSLTAGQTHELRVQMKGSDPGHPFQIHLAVPANDDQVLFEPLIERASNNRFRAPAALPDNPPSLGLYGGYLRLSGLRVLPDSRLRFSVFKYRTGSPTEREYVGTTEARFVQPPSTSGTWDADLRMDFSTVVDPDEFFVVFAKASLSDGRHRYSTTAKRIVLTQIKAVPSSLPVISDAPRIAATAQAIASVTPPQADQPYRLTKRRFHVQTTLRDPGDLSQDLQVVLFLDNEQHDLQLTTNDNRTTWQAEIEVPAEGEYALETAIALGDQVVGKRSPAARVSIRSTGPQVQSVNPLTASLDRIRVTFDEPVKELKSGDPLKAIFELKPDKPADAQILTPSKMEIDESGRTITLHYNPDQIAPGIYTFTVRKDTDRSLKNLFDLALAEEYSERLFRAIGADEPLTAPGIPGPTGPHVEFPEYVEPRPIVNGFNPSDHVETRVSRLYYYRDAHRVAQIVNRDVKSYNRAAVQMQEQLANKARQIADQATDNRQAKERRAVEAAKKTREMERELAEAEATARSASAQAAAAVADLRRADFDLQRLPPGTPERAAIESRAANTQRAVARLEDVASVSRARVDSLRNQIQESREQEAQAHEAWQEAIATEDRAREEQFRREVAAANADPDTYAPGKPKSPDPVRQVSVSVIGEGLIQLRGPIKGINIIRTMINQIDAPVGQVRVGVHTVQVNGERGDRMEKVTEQIQRYIDHSRFLTMQSAEMLRNAIVQVAAQKAVEVNAQVGITQEERDRKYLYAFFGEDFIRELEVMDSEFLQTGNKLLSLHSMDSTSLASALFLMALAKNSTRLEIINLFEQMMATQLPAAEQTYFEAGFTATGDEKCRDKHKGESFQLLSKNARFQSLRGFFNVEIALDDTMSPLQREFIRLAQIFKSRLIVELELKQRIMERAVIEERLGNHQKELEDALDMEKKARDKLRTAQEMKRGSQKRTVQASLSIQNATDRANRHAYEIRSIAAGYSQRIEVLLTSLVDDALTRGVGGDRRPLSEILKLNDVQQREVNELLSRQRQLLLAELPLTETLAARIVNFRNAYWKQLAHYIPAEQAALRQLLSNPSDAIPVKADSSIMIQGKEVRFSITVDPTNNTMTIEPDSPKHKQQIADYRKELLAEAISRADKARELLARFKLLDSEQREFQEAEQRYRIMKGVQTDPTTRPGMELEDLLIARDLFRFYDRLGQRIAGQMKAISDASRSLIVHLDDDEVDARLLYQQWLGIRQGWQSLVAGDLPDLPGADLDAASQSFQTLLEADLDYQFALREAEASRRPLDHKKFLDMLVDEMEDKYIELLEGTRAHTSNIDAYIKRLMTALDDDYNTQFYYPAFRHVRRASQFYDVTLGQVETTTVLANNRSFAKVEPQATMEFDLPKRDIVIAEAINGAKATIDDIGALAQDPTFLALARLNAGQPTSTPAGGAAGGLSTVRNVLPGLSTSTAEDVLSQQGPGGSQFGAALESLIPDPAIYKFETGTGFEIRPVIEPDGQSVVFDFNYMYTTNVREPVRADEKHLGRVKRHFVHTDVQLSNFELREVSRYTVALKASRTARGVPLLEDAPVIGVLFRPLPSDESSLQQNIILAQSTIFPTLFDLMGLRWAPAVADLDPLRLVNDEFIVRSRRRTLMNRVFDHSSSRVDEFLRIPPGERRMDLYRSQETIPDQHPNGYLGPGANLRDSQLREGYDPSRRPETHFIPGESPEGSPLRPQRPLEPLRAPLPGASSRLSPTPGGYLPGPGLPGPETHSPALSDPGRPRHHRGQPPHAAPLHGEPLHGESLHGEPLPLGHSSRYAPAHGAHGGSGIQPVQYLEPRGSEDNRQVRRAGHLDSVYSEASDVYAESSAGTASSRIRRLPSTGEPPARSFSVAGPSGSRPVAAPRELPYPVPRR